MLLSIYAVSLSFHTMLGSNTNYLDSTHNTRQHFTVSINLKKNGYLKCLLTSTLNTGEKNN